MRNFDLGNGTVEEKLVKASRAIAQLNRRSQKFVSFKTPLLPISGYAPSGKEGDEVVKFMCPAGVIKRMGFFAVSATGKKEDLVISLEVKSELSQSMEIEARTSKLLDKNLEIKIAFGTRVTVKLEQCPELADVWALLLLAPADESYSVSQQAIEEFEEQVKNFEKKAGLPLTEEPKEEITEE